MAARKLAGDILGTVFAFRLWNGKYAYARLYSNACLGIYPLLTDFIATLDHLKFIDIAFIQWAAKRVYKNKEWEVLGVIPFCGEEESKPPLMATMYLHELDKWTMGEPYIMHPDGETRKATRAEVSGLEVWSIAANSRMFDMCMRVRFSSPDYATKRVPVYAQ